LLNNFKSGPLADQALKQSLADNQSLNGLLTTRTNQVDKLAAEKASLEAQIKKLS
jgi:cell division protein FtsB